MLLLRLWNYIRGYVIILVEGYFLEKFVNICVHRQIFLWDIKRSKNSALTLKASIKGFKAIRPVARKTKCRVRIIKKKGVPFFLNRYRRRKAFIVGPFLFILLLYAMTSFIWSVEVTGNKEIGYDLLIETLARNGIKPGVLKFGIDTDRVVNNMILEIDKLSWVSVTIKGTKAKVQVAERTVAPELVPKNVPCDIIAKRDGVITSVIVKDGYEMVKAGDTVVKGQVLISGRVPIKNETEKVRYVHSIGSVTARTWYEKSSQVNMKRVQKVKTGRTKDHISLILFTKRIKLFSGEIDFADYEKVEIRKRLSLGEDLVLPFEIVIDRFYENNVMEEELDIEEAKKLSADSALSEVMRDIPPDAKILKTYANYVKDKNNGLVAKVTVECLEEIGLKKEIGGE
ncbi:MAG TPA: sporulation protein YqfD [Clostridiaceae bacterium]|nr:sporulation protein YqfD [Clostridiaceae bacterium]